MVHPIRVPDVLAERPCAGLARRCLAVALLLLPCGPVLAHAGLEQADPAAGSRVAAAPAHVMLRFTERLEPAFSRVEVDDAAGRRVDKGDAAVSPTDAAVLAVSLPTLPPGRYTVKWHVLSVDTHATEGHFDFEIGH